MTDIPKFFEKFQPPPEPPQPVLANPIPQSISHKPVSPGQRPRKFSFSLRDWEFLVHLADHGEASNGELAKLFGTTLSAASLRVKRLAKMKLISVAYESWQDTGKVNKRIVTVNLIPEKPWSPE